MSTFTIDMLAHPLPQANSAASIAALRYIFSANGLRESDSDVDEGLCIVQEETGAVSVEYLATARSF